MVEMTTTAMTTSEMTTTTARPAKSSSEMGVWTVMRASSEKRPTPARRCVSVHWRGLKRVYRTTLSQRKTRCNEKAPDAGFSGPAGSSPDAGYGGGDVARPQSRNVAAGSGPGVHKSHRKSATMATMKITATVHTRQPRPQRITLNTIKRESWFQRRSNSESVIGSPFSFRR